jgi:hypothetical protein
MGLYSVSTNSFTLTAATAKTVIRIATPATRSARLRKLVATDGSNESTGLTVRVATGGTGGTGGTGTDATPAPLGSSVASLCTAKIDFSGEPTGTTLREAYSFGAGGGISERFDGDEGIEVPHSSAISIVVTATDARAAGECSVTAVFED